MTLSNMGFKTEVIVPGKIWTYSDSAEDYQGTYTVAMPVRSISCNPGGIAPTGTPTLILNMTSVSQYKSGRMTWAGTLADGTAISGSATLLAGVPVVLDVPSSEECACLPIIKKSNSETFGAMAAIAKGAMDRSSEGDDVTRYRAVGAPTFTTSELGDVMVRPCWSRTEGADGTANSAVWEIEYDLNGSIYNLENGLEQYCEESLGTKHLAFEIRMPDDSAAYEALKPDKSLELVINANRFTPVSEQGDPYKLTISTERTGRISGTFTLPYEDVSGKVKYVKATYKGVFLTGWSASCCECSDGDLPFIMGAWTYADTYKDDRTGKVMHITRGGAVVGARRESE